MAYKICQSRSKILPNSKLSLKLPKTFEYFPKVARIRQIRPHWSLLMFSLRFQIKPQSVALLSRLQHPAQLVQADHHPRRGEEARQTIRLS